MVQYKHQVIVIIPTHLEELSPNDERILLNNCQKLSDYNLEIIVPAKNDISWFENFSRKHDLEINIKRVDNKYFGSSAAVNKMGMDPAFYDQYRDYRYMLICHLDVWIFRNDLEYWVSQDYDFVGAPLFLPKVGNAHFTKRMAPFGCNGGYSLRKIDAISNHLKTFKPKYSLYQLIRAFSFLFKNYRFDLAKILLKGLVELKADWRATCNKYNIYEDAFISIVSPLLGSKLKIPKSSHALRFSCEVNYDLIQKEILINDCPSGVHGFDKYVAPEYFDYITSYFERCNTIEVKPLEDPLVSIIMTIKNLVAGNRVESFKRSIQSVIDQDYGNIEIVIMDGASDDGTYEQVIEPYLAQANIRYQSKLDSGVWEGINNGIAAATGDLIGVMNSDDCFNSNHAVSKLVKAMETADADWSFSGAYIITPDTKFKFPTNAVSVLHCFGIVHQATLFKKALIERIDPFLSGHITAENYLFTESIAKGYKYAEVTEPLVDYHTGGVSETMYQGENKDRTVSDFVAYVKKTTSLGEYFDDQTIQDLYGLQIVVKYGFINYFRKLFSIKDKRIRNMLLMSLFSHAKNFGVKRLFKRKLKALVTRKSVS